MDNKDNYSNKIYIENSKNINQEFLLYFSNNCNHSQKLLDELNKKDMLKKVNLICIDNRLKKNNITYIVINEQEMPLPPMINCVPTMCIKPNNEILKGKEIYNYFVPLTKTIKDEREKINLEPNPFSIGNETIGEFGVTSDNFSFWDTTPEDLSASGDGGNKQLYNYVSINNGAGDEIYTPEQEDSTQTKNNMTIEQLQKMRNEEL